MSEITTTVSGKRRLTPSWIVSQLDQYVIGQDEAKRTLAVVVYAHYRKLARSGGTVEIAKSNVLLIGPTGTGKTLLCETLSRTLRVPFVTVDATSLAQSRHLPDEIEALLQRLIDRADGDLARAQNGIVFIDEVDKLKAGEGTIQHSSGESVQHALLKVMEGRPVKLADGRSIDTTNILFICGGTFVGLEKITAGSHAFGFVATSGNENQQILDRLNARIKPTDLFDYGLIPEFAGRLPVIANFQPLSRQMLVRIMTQPRNSIYSQFRQILRNEGVDLVIEPRVFEQISELAAEYKVGARGLRGIFEEVISPVMYAIPDQPEVRQVVINSLFENAVLLAEPLPVSSPST
ncbi:MAG TPA: AAA family ATPase [Rhodocyclaceae bacterium]|nr:AAA family ATPase [Rhodocyclaceae bacterium]